MKTIFDPQLDIFSISEEEIARQICVIEFRLFSKIRVCFFSSFFFFLISYYFLCIAFRIIKSILE